MDLLSSFYHPLRFTKFSSWTVLPMIHDLDYVNLGMDGVLIGTSRQVGLGVGFCSGWCVVKNYSVLLR
jgi:hypothetical protein